MDAYRFETYDEILDEIDKERFDMEVINKYVDQCKSEGVSFNIFDEERPFMQMEKSLLTTYVEDKEKSISVVSRLSPALPSGRNDIFINHIDYDDYYNYYKSVGFKPSDDITHDFYSDEVLKDAKVKRSKVSAESVLKMTYSDFTKNLILAHVCSGSGGAGYTRSISIEEKPPFYLVINGENLFQTLLFMSLPVTNVEDKPMWRWESYNGCATPEFLENFGILSGMFYPLRMICFSKEHTGNGYVRKVHFYPVTYKGIEDTKEFLRELRVLWKKIEPHVYYKKEAVKVKKQNEKSEEEGLKTEEKNKKTEIEWVWKAIEYHHEKQSWLSIIAFSNLKHLDIKKRKIPRVLESYVENEDEYSLIGNTDLSFYYYEREKGQDVAYCSGVIEYKFPKKMLYTTDLFEIYEEWVYKYHDILEKNVKKCLKSYVPSKSGSKNSWTKNIISNITGHYFGKCEDLFFESFINDDELLSSDMDVYESAKNKYYEKIIDIAKMSFELARMHNKNHIEFAKHKIQLDKDINNEIKK